MNRKKEIKFCCDHILPLKQSQFSSVHLCSCFRYFAGRLSDHLEVATVLLLMQVVV